MPIDRLARARKTLPEGFQFGDGAKQPSVRGRSGALFIFEDETSAARFAFSSIQASIGFTANVIEGEHHE